jgi:hypothetical protein
MGDQRHEPVALHKQEKALPIQMSSTLLVDELAIFPPPLRPASTEQQQVKLWRPVSLPIVR